MKGIEPGTVGPVATDAIAAPQQLKNCKKCKWKSVNWKY